MRQILLDTETTGLDHQQGHRIIEIGCVELDNRRLTGRHFHQYLKPDREIEEAAIDVHGRTNEFLADKPVFAAVADEFLAFIDENGTDWGMASWKIMRQQDDVYLLPKPEYWEARKKQTRSLKQSTARSLDDLLK